MSEQNAANGTVFVGDPSPPLFRVPSHSLLSLCQRAPFLLRQWSLVLRPQWGARAPMHTIPLPSWHALYLQQPDHVTIEPVRKEVVSHKLGRIGGHLLCPAVLGLRPLHLFHEVAEVALDGHVVIPWDYLPVEVFIVAGVLLEDEGAPSHQEGKPIGGYSAVYADLVFVLWEEREGGGGGGGRERR